METWIVNRVWVPDPEIPGGGAWDVPGVGLTALLSFESAPQIAGAVPGKTVIPCLATYASSPGAIDGVRLAAGDPRDTKASKGALDKWEASFGRRPSGDSLADCIADQMIFGADPAGIDSAFPIQPTIDGRVEVIARKGVRFLDRRHIWGAVPAYDALLVDCLRKQVARRRSDAEAGLLRKLGQVDFDGDRKFVDWLAEKYVGLDPNKKADFCRLLQFEKPLVPHETNLNDDFNRATLNGGTYSYTNIFGALAINASIQLTGSGNGVFDRTRLESDLSGTDHYCQILVQSVSASTVRFAGLMCRYDSAADTAYLMRLFGNATSATTAQDRILRMYTLTTGTLVAIGVGTTNNSAMGIPIKLSVSSTTMELYYNGSLVESFSNGAFSGPTRIGVAAQGGANSTLMDDLAAADLGGGGGGGGSAGRFLTLMGCG